MGEYIDADDFHISICAADTIFTYSQDKIGLTHYLFFVGAPTAGKSNNLTIFQFLAYRSMTSTEISYQNIYQYLGSQDEGVGTICEDEADTIDEDRQKMRIYKNGYITGRPVTKIDTNSPNGRVQYKFNTFCFKAFSAERLPDSLKGKGFNQRILEIPCFYGFPEFDISEVVNPAGEEKFQELLDELLDIRKLLLIYRLQHYNDKIPDIKTNLKNRERQLFKPVLRVFQNTETFNELLPIISNYINQKRENNSNTLNAYVYKVIKHLIQQENSHELRSSLIWETITQLVINGVDNPVWLNGEPIPGKTLSYSSVEFGELSQKVITEICKDVFGAEKSKKGLVKWTFDQSKFKRIGKIYNLPAEIKIKTGNDANVDDVDDVDDVGDIGLDKVPKDDRKADDMDDNEIHVQGIFNNNDIIETKIEQEEDTSIPPCDEDRPDCPDRPDAQGEEI